MKSHLARLAAAAALAAAAFTGAFGQSGLSAGATMRALGGASSSGSGSSGSSSFGGVSGTGSDAFNFSLTQTPHLAPGMILPSDNSINENEYLIGSGDVFFISAIESPTVKYTAAVDQTGRAFIQNVGLVNVGKNTYADAKKIIAQYISSKLKNPSEIYVTLIQTKNATVSFTGRVRSPGSYDLPGTMRLLDAIRRANDGDLPQVSDADLRQIKCVRGDSVAIYDLLAYLYQNDNSQNPYIYPGDQIRINTTSSEVFISGAIKSPAAGYYPIKQGETLKGFLSMFTFYNTADLENVIVYQPSDNSSQAFDALDSSYVLNDLDAITIPIKKNHPGMYTVSITGEIASPGRYPIIENYTTARQLIEKAGGMKETGNIDQAVVIRLMRSLPDRFNNGAAQMNAVRPERGTSVAMATTSLDYTVIRLVLYNADKVVLEPDDQIVIPKKDSFVYVSGGVKNPGAYPFMIQKDDRYYITQAGGFSRSADKSNIQVFVKYGDVVQSIEPRCIEPGSVVIVPTSVQNKMLTQLILPVVTAVITTIGVGISIYNVGTGK